MNYTFLKWPNTISIPCELWCRLTVTFVCDGKHVTYQDGCQPGFSVMHLFLMNIFYGSQIGQFTTEKSK